MKKRKRSRTVLVFLGLLVCAALLGGCGKSDSGRIGPATASVLSAATPTAGLNTCVSCHTTVTVDWLTSKHANVDPVGNLYSAGVPTVGLVQAGPGCISCHDPNGDSNNLTAGYTGNVARPVIGCETCHGPGSLHADAGGAGPISLLSNTTGTTFGTETVSGQFVMCTSCHELLDTAGTGTNPNPAHLTTDPTGTQYSITDTHFATPGDWSGAGSANIKDITGYAMNYADERVCSTCHNPHKPPTQNREWAQSAHGDTNPFNLNSKKTGYFSGAWAHYNWSTRPTCQRCHTTTAFSAYADALRSGNQALADAINMGTLVSSPVTSTASWKPEMLTCNGCHTDNRGTLRNPGAITANYDYISSGKTYARASHTYPDVAGSNVCMTCHVGREIGDTIKGLNNPSQLSSTLPSELISFFTYTNASFINSHYLTAGGQVFTTTGYEFDGRPYNNIPEYRHDKIGTPATLQLSPYVDTGTNGPCIGCHMSRPNKNGNHLFLPVSRSTTTIGEVTGIASEVCFNCHGPSTTIILDLVREQKQQYMEALEALKDQIESNLNIYFFPYSPYWYKTSAYTDPKAACTDNVPVKNWQTGGTQAIVDAFPTCTYTGNNDGTPGTGQNNMGAAFNFNLLEHDPGAYVHNRMYVKRLIYDSIDWVDDGVMNYSVGATLNALPGTATYKAEAIMYLLPNGVLGIEAERP
jgi:hypothetical protein